MESTIAYCGLDCSTCLIHFATLEEDFAVKSRMRIEIADKLAKIYNTTPKPEIICDCDGCKVVDGRLFTGCTSCEIRKCAMDTSLENCAYCRNYPCDKLMRHFAIDREAQVRLEEIRRKNYIKNS